MCQSLTAGSRGENYTYSLMILIALASAASSACEEPSAKDPSSPAGQEHALVGARAPDFELPAQVGEGPLSPSAHSGKVVIVDFWATWCAPCRESFPAYERLTHEQADVVVLGVSVDDEPDGIASFVADTKVHFPVGWDRDQRVSKLYKPAAMPTSYLIDQNGIVRHVHAGYHSGDDAVIAQQVTALLQ